MADNRNHGRQDTGDTGSPQTRARDDLRTATKKGKPNEERAKQRDQETREKKDDE